MKRSGSGLNIGPERWRPRARLGLVVIPAVVLLGVLVFMRPRSAAVLLDPQPLRGSQPYATLLCRFAGSPGDTSTVEPPSYYDRVMMGDSHSLDNYWRQVSYGAINLAGSKAFGWFQMQKPASDYIRPNGGAPDLAALARDCSGAAEAAGDPTLHFRDYVGLNLVFSECLDRSRGGAVDLNLDGRTRTYRTTWLCPGYASSQQIMAHEMGHSFGLTHSEDSQGAEYGNNWDLMSNEGYCAPTTDVGTLAQQPIAYDKDVLGWIAPADKYVASATGVVKIQMDYLENQRGDSPGFLMAEIPLSGGRFYTIEARSRSGYDEALPAPGILIHEINPKRENKARLITGPATVGPSALLSSHGGWPVGSAFVDSAENVGVSVDSRTSTGFVVTLYTGALPWPKDPSQPSPGLQQARADNATVLEWTAVKGARQYEIQVSHLTPRQRSANTSQGSAPAADWGADFVSDQPYLVAKLADGEYRWAVRVLPDGGWSPSQTVVAGNAPVWQAPEQVAQVDGSLRVPPMVNVDANGGVDVAWAQANSQRSVAVTQAALQGSTWEVRDLFNVPGGSRRSLALSYTPAGDLKLAWPAAAVDGMSPSSNAAVAVDSGGRAHTIWAGSGALSGLFSAVVDARAPSAGPASRPTSRVQPVPVAPDAVASTSYTPALALDRNGKAQAVWVDTRGGHSAVYTTEEQADGSWSEAKRISNSNETVDGRPTIVVDAAGNAYAVWQGSVDCGGASGLEGLSFAERPAGSDWRPAVTLAVPSIDNTLIDPTVAVNDRGELFVAWGEMSKTGYNLYSTYRTSDRRWTSPRLAAEGQTDSSSIALSLAVNTQGNAFLTWPETHGQQTSIRFAATR